MLPFDYQYAVRVHARALRGASVPLRYRQGDGFPILLLPGVYETWTTLRWLADAMNAEGHPIVVAPGMKHNRRPIAETAVLAQRVLDDNDLRDVVILAHSKGGLVGKTMMLDTDVDSVAGPRIARMVAVNSPFQGSRMARYVPTRAFKAFLPGDAHLTRLGSMVDVNAWITSVHSDFDGHVPDGSHLEGAPNVQVPLDGHFRPLGHPVGRALILAALRG
jgi:hypothetical protein